jgi:hypothetical protein
LTCNPPPATRNLRNLRNLNNPDPETLDLNTRDPKPQAYRYRRRRAEQASKRMAAVADKRGVKKPVTIPAAPAPAPKKSPPGTRLTVVLPTTGVAAFQSAAIPRRTPDVLDTPPPTATNFLLPKTDWGTELAALVHPSHRAREMAAARDPSPVDSVVSGGEEDEGSTAHTSPVDATWSAKHTDWACASVGEFSGGVAGGISIEDEALGGMYGHMCASAFAHESEDSGDDVLSEALLAGATGDWGGARRHPALEEEQDLDLELDEALWLRKTYETVYNPAARQRALQALVSGSGGFAPGKRAEPEPFSAGFGAGFECGGFGAPQPARKCTVVYDYC